MIKTKLQTKLLFVLVSISAAPLIILFSVSTVQFEKNFESNVMYNYQNIAREVAKIIENIFIERIGDMNVLARNKIILSPQATPEEKREELLKVQNAYNIYDDITLIDTNGNVITSTTYNYRGEWLTNKWFQDALAGKSVASDAHIILDPYKVVTGISVPILDENNKTKYVISGQIDMKSIWDITDKARANGAGYAYIVNNNNRFIANPNKNLLFEKLDPEIQECELGQRSYQNNEGVKTVEGYAPLLNDIIYNGNECWRIVVSNTREEAFSALRLLRLQMVGLFAMVLLVSLGISRIYSRKVSKPLLEISSAAEELGKGNFGHRVDIKTGDELEHLAERFNQASEALANIDKEHKELEESKTRFLSIISHELRSPMTAIKGETQLLNKGYKGKLSAAQKQSVQTVERNANRLDSIIVDLLDISRIEAARLKIEAVKIDLTPKILEVIEGIRLQTAERKIKIIPRIHSIPAIETDPDRVVQILRNLIGNAVKFSKDKSEVIVTAEPHEKGELLFSVKDFGIGISPENQERVFEPFFQEEQSIYRKYGGTGLGLTIAKGIVEALGGKIWFKSTKGKGTTFYFTLPPKPPKERKAFNFLLTHEKYIASSLREILLDYLGPLGDVVYTQTSIKGLHREDIVRRIEALKDKSIIDKEKYAKLKKEIESIFEKYSPNQKEET